MLALTTAVCAVLGILITRSHGAAPGSAQIKSQVPPAADVWRAIFVRPTGIPSPAENPPSLQKAALGRSLFFDTRLSGDGKRSCATCHDPNQGFSDGRTLGLGRDGNPLQRNTPALWNLAWGKSFYWDGRKASLEEQARVPIEHPNEMNGSLDTIARVLRRDPLYKQMFHEAFAPTGTISAVTILQAIASYERALVSPQTRFDQWMAGNRSAITIREHRGFQLFVGKAGCLACHGGWRLTDERFHDIGLQTNDLGRGAFADPDGPKAPRFKTPSLRELLHTAPYMHDGSIPTLAGVIDHYAGGFEDRPSLAANMVRSLTLTQQERDDLVAFLGTLSSSPESLAPRARRLHSETE